MEEFVTQVLKRPTREQFTAVVQHHELGPFINELVIREGVLHHLEINVMMAADRIEYLVEFERVPRGPEYAAT